MHLLPHGSDLGKLTDRLPRVHHGIVKPHQLPRQRNLRRVLDADLSPTEIIPTDLIRRGALRLLTLRLTLRLIVITMMVLMELRESD